MFALECVNDSTYRKSIPSPVSPTLSGPSSHASKVTVSSDASDATAATPYDLSTWERTTYYNGISIDPPELLYRSDLLTNPFPIPKGRHPHLPTKTVYGVFNTPLNPVWHIVAPRICNLLKSRKIRYSAIKAARFVIHGEDGKDTLGPIVIWIATHPTTTTAKLAHDASPDILALLKTYGVEGAVVEWYEGTVEKLSGPPLLRVTEIGNPTHHVRRFLTAALGMPIATAEREDADAEGSVALFFHENKDQDGNPSARVFGVSCCHVLRANTTLEYEFKGSGASRQHVRLAGLRRYQRGIDEIKDSIAGTVWDLHISRREIARLEAKPRSQDPEEMAEDEVTLEMHRVTIGKLKKDIVALENFYKDLGSQWSDIGRRNIGHVHWAPSISVDDQGTGYTQDIGTFEVDAVKFKAQFKGNVVDLGTWDLVFLMVRSSNEHNV